MADKVDLQPWHILNSEKAPDTCVLLLPGRDNYGPLMGRAYYSLGLHNSLLVSITPVKYEWYPMPNGADDQEDAISGQVAAYHTIDGVVRRITEKYGIPRNKIVLCGYSAGGVMAIQVAAYSKEPFAGVVVHCGAILDPSMLPLCNCPETQFLLTHYEDDIIFEWFERYLPMKNALIAQGYKVYTLEQKHGGHLVGENDLIRSRFFMEACLKGLQHG